MKKHKPSMRLDYQDIKLARSNVREELEHRNFMHALLPFIDAFKRSKETLVTFAQFIVVLAIVAYFGAHFIVWIAEGEPTPQAHAQTYYVPHYYHSSPNKK